MPNYRRHYQPGPVFVTLVTHQRRPWLVDAATEVSASLHRCQAKHSFRHLAHVLLPDHLHWLFEPTDSNFSAIVATFKRDLTWHLKAQGETRPLWQARFFTTTAFGIKPTCTVTSITSTTTRSNTLTAAVLTTGRIRRFKPGWHAAPTPQTGASRCRRRLPIWRWNEYSAARYCRPTLE